MKFYSTNTKIINNLIFKAKVKFYNLLKKQVMMIKKKLL